MVRYINIFLLISLIHMINARSQRKRRNIAVRYNQLFRYEQLPAAADGVGPTLQGVQICVHRNPATHQLLGSTGKFWKCGTLTYDFRKTYCNATTCNKCLSYLNRHAIRGNTGSTMYQHWFLCSALARHDNCCRFNLGPSLFTY